MSHRNHSAKKLSSQKSSCKARCCRSESDSYEEHNRSKNKCSCKPKRISNVPITITKSGRYCVTRNLQYDDDLVAITIKANNVSIDFNQFNLSLTNGAAIGVSGIGFQNIEIKNGTIELKTDVIPTAITSAAILFDNIVKVTIDNIVTNNNFSGIVINRSEGILITNVTQKNHERSGLSDRPASISITDSFDIIIRDSAMSARPSPSSSFTNSNGIVIATSQNIIIQDINMNNVDGGIYLRGTNNVNIDKLNVSLTPSNPFNFITIGSPTLPSINTIIKNSTFISKGEAIGADGIILQNGNDALIQNVILYVNSSPYEPGAITGAINIGIGPNSFSNVKIIDTVVSGPNVDAIVVGNGNNVTLDNVVVSDALENNIRLITARNVTIKNSDVQRGNINGINIEARSNCNTISSTNIRDNGAGLLINGNNNIVRDSNIYCNVANVQDTGLNNQFVNNIY